MAGWQLHVDRHRQGQFGQQRGDFHRSSGRRRFGRSHRLSAAALDRRPELYDRQDQARGAPVLQFELAGAVHPLAFHRICRCLPGIFPMPGRLRHIFKEIRIERLGLGKF